MSSDGESTFDVKAQMTNAATALLGRVKPETSTADMAAAVDKATAALRFVADTEMNALAREKIDQEIRKLKDENATVLERQRWEGRRNFIIALTPILAIFTFVVAQLLQNWQFSARQEFDSAQLAAKQQSDRDSALEAELRKAAENLLSDAEISPISVSTIQRSLDSSTVQESARDFVVEILKKRTDTKLLDDLFDRAFAPTGSATFESEKANFRRLTGLSRALLVSVSPIWTKWYLHELHSKSPAENPADPGELSAAENEKSSYTQAASSRISSAIGRFLTLRPKGLSIDISRTHIILSDWRNIDFEGVNIAGTHITRINLRGAKLAGISEFSDLAMQETAWWEAETIDKKFLDHLKSRSPYNQSVPYGLDFKLVSKQEYEEALTRLERKLK